jgi:hypothetical protein
MPNSKFHQKVCILLVEPYFQTPFFDLAPLNQLSLGSYFHEFEYFLKLILRSKDGYRFATNYMRKYYAMAVFIVMAVIAVGCLASFGDGTLMN